MESVEQNLIHLHDNRQLVVSLGRQQKRQQFVFLLDFFYQVTYVLVVHVAVLLFRRIRFLLRFTFPEKIMFFCLKKSRD
jgi:hypothetical protein